MHIRHWVHVNKAILNEAALLSSYIECIQTHWATNQIYFACFIHIHSMSKISAVTGKLIIIYFWLAIFTCSQSVYCFCDLVIRWHEWKIIFTFTFLFRIIKAYSTKSKKKVGWFVIHLVAEKFQRPRAIHGYQPLPHVLISWLNENTCTVINSSTVKKYLF